MTIDKAVIETICITVIAVAIGRIINSHVDVQELILSFLF